MKKLLLAIAIAITFATPMMAQANRGLLISSTEIAALPSSGAEWSALKSHADKPACTPNLEDMNDDCNVTVLAQALVFAKTRNTAYETKVLSALRAIVNSGTYSGKALPLARELGTYALAADLVDLPQRQPALDSSFKTKIKSLLRTPTSDGGPASVVACHEQRPNNWGTHCGATRIAVDLYVGDTADLAKAANIFAGWLGDRSKYAGFKYGALDWQCDSTRPVGINRAGCVKSTRNIDGVLPDDQRRAGGFTWPPPKENYVYEALQGALLQAILLSRQGYDAWGWSDKALLRAFVWLHNQAKFPADGDDTWQPYVVKRFYGNSFPAPATTQPGKAFGFTEWLYKNGSTPPPPPPPPDECMCPCACE